MINILSRISASSASTGGSLKVFRNLTRGLERIGLPYVVNRSLDSCERIWVHDDVRAVPYLPPDARVVLGPNIYTFDLPTPQLPERMIFVYPSEWPRRHMQMLGYGAEPSAIWPVGVDVDEFPPRPIASQSKVLLYYKNRPPEALREVEALLHELGIEYRLLRYGSYREDELRAALAGSRYAVWLAGSESQGLAMLETLASGVPVVVYDCTSLAMNWMVELRVDAEVARLPVTSAPYFDDRCGMKATSMEDLRAALLRMNDAWTTYRPRDFVVEQLSLEKQARALVGLWDRIPPAADAPMGRPAIAPAEPLRLPPTWVVRAVLRQLRRRRFIRSAGELSQMAREATLS